MAKKNPTIRVHQLAKEIGVTSKDIVKKCSAEEVPGIQNHMSAVSIGLAATIREWFGTSEEARGVATAISTSAPVDVERAKERAKKVARKATRKKQTVAAGDSTPGESDSSSTATQTAEPPVVKKTPVVEKPPVVETLPPIESYTEPHVIQVTTETPTIAAETPVADTPVDTPTDDVKVAAKASPGSSPEPGDRPEPVMNQPVRPDVISPAGPKLEKPLKTTLAGPKVIRVEAPDSVPQPRRSSDRPMGRGGPRAGRGVGGPPPSDGPVQIDRGRGGGGANRRNKRRSASAADTSRRPATPAAGDAGRPFNWREQDLVERERRLNRAGGFFKAARRDNLKRSGGAGFRTKSAAQTGGSVRIVEPITIKELSAQTGVKQNDIVRELIKDGSMVTSMDQVISSEIASALMSEYDIELEIIEQKTAEEQIVADFEQREMQDERPRSPVVTILGHVDHGKTSLLDGIRNAKVAEGEAGGITQATSAFRVSVHVGDVDREITFIDTPGHEAFTEMRARGAQVTDIVVLVVAADDGVMPQTIESINHAKAADVPIIVALNKIDKPEATDANIQRILGELAEHGLNPVEWGGQTEVMRISALKKEGITELLEIIDYQAQLLELTADFGGQAQGSVLEAQLEEGRGAVASILVQHGRLKKGDFIVAGRAYGRVRDLINDRGERVQEGHPSMPLAMSGLNEVPDAGDKIYIVKNIRAAEAAAGERRHQERQRDLATEKVTLDNIFSKLQETERKQLPLIVKGDVQGSVETLKATLEKISTDEITIAIKHSAVGGVNDSDILLAETTGAIILGFNVTTTGKARKLAESKRIDVRLYDVIYDVTDDVKKAAEGLLEPEYKLEVLGHAEVREVFRISKVGLIAGCYCTDGVIERNAQIRVTRDGIVVEKDRRLEQLKRFKDDAKEVRSGQECGMRIDGYDDIKVGDILECYKTLEVKRTL